MRNLRVSDFIEAAKIIGCDVATVQAVCDVEAAGSGFDEQGRLKLRFEGHRFRKFTRGKFDQSHPHLSYPYSRENLKRFPHGYSAFNEAFTLDPHAAMIATSWGMFQPMGEYFEECGFSSVDEMLNAYRQGEREQLLGFVRQVKSRGLDDELRRRDWRGFARVYNGADFEANNYDSKLDRAWRFHKAKGLPKDIDQPIDRDLARSEAAPPALDQTEPLGNPSAESAQAGGGERSPVSPPPPAPVDRRRAVEPAQSIKDKPRGTLPNEAVDVQMTAPAKERSSKSLIATLGALVTGIGLTFGDVLGYFKQAIAGANPTGAIMIIAVLALIGLVYWKYQERQTRLDEIDRDHALKLNLEKIRIASNPDLYTVELKPNITPAEPEQAADSASISTG